MALMTEDRYLTVEQVADRMQLHPETVREMLRNRQLPGKKVGREWRTSPTQLEEFIRSQEEATGHKK